MESKGTETGRPQEAEGNTQEKNPGISRIPRNQE